MGVNVSMTLLQSCVETLENTLRDDERIVQVRVGRPHFSHNTTTPFLVDIAKVINGDTATDPRVVIVHVESNPPHRASIEDISQKIRWNPLY